MKIVACLALVLLLAACSGPPEPQSSNAAPTASATAHKPTPLDPLLKSEDKARGVSKTLEDADQKRRQAIKDAGG